MNNATQVRLLVIAATLFNACGASDSMPEDATAGIDSGEAGGGDTAAAGSAGTGGIGFNDAGSAESASATSGSDAGGASEASSPLPDGGPPAIGPEVKLVDLTDPQKGALCDWMTAALGGYGTTNDCGGNAVMNYADQTQCIAAGLHYQCMSATVGQFEKCVLAEIPSLGCNTPTEACKALYCVQ